MEPLSVGASVLAVVGATGKLVKGIRRLKALHDAPRKLDDLLAEISQFELVIQAVHNAHENRGPELGKLLGTATEVLVEFESLIQYKLTEAGTSDKVDHWQWTRNSKDVERLQGKLRDVTTKVVALVGVDTSISIHQVAQTTDQVLTEQRQINKQMLLANSLLVNLLEGSPPTRAALTSSLGEIRQLTLRSSSQENYTVPEPTQSPTYQVVPAVRRLQGQSMASVKKVKEISNCDRSCACKCHVRRRLGALGIVFKLFGHGYVETAGLGMLGSQCDVESCGGHAALRVSVQYILPQWLASRMISMWYTSSPPCSPELLLRVPRVLTQDNLAIQAIEKNDVEMLKIAISRGHCTSYDVNIFGWSLLDVAAFGGTFRALVFLSSHDDFRTSVISSFTESNIFYFLTVLQYHNGYNVEWQTLNLWDVFSMIDWENQAKMQSFTRLHQVVCGITVGSLDVELQDTTAIDRLDKKGRSALWYAVRQRRPDLVRKLLERGADPKIGDPPLWEATSVPTSYEITKMLLEHGANPNHRATRYGAKNVTLLLERSTYFNCDLAQLIEILISFGADIELTDEEGKTAVMCAINSANVDAFRVFVAASARLDRKSITGSTILHLAIIHTSHFSTLKYVSKLCKAMRDTDLTSIDIGAEDEDGNTAHDLLRIRNTPNWNSYCRSKGVEFWGLEMSYRLGHELKAIKALEKLLHHIQEIQGVPEADRYPPLGEYGSRDPNDQEVPGAWPAYETDLDEARLHGLNTLELNCVILERCCLGLDKKHLSQ